MIRLLLIFSILILWLSTLGIFYIRIKWEDGLILYLPSLTPKIFGKKRNPKNKLKFFLSVSPQCFDSNIKKSAPQIIEI